MTSISRSSRTFRWKSRRYRRRGRGCSADLSEEFGAYIFILATDPPLNASVGALARLLRRAITWQFLRRLTSSSSHFSLPSQITNRHHPQGSAPDEGYRSDPHRAVSIHHRAGSNTASPRVHDWTFLRRYVRSRHVPNQAPLLRPRYAPSLSLLWDVLTENTPRIHDRTNYILARLSSQLPTPPLRRLSRHPHSILRDINLTSFIRPLLLRLPIRLL